MTKKTCTYPPNADEEEFCGKNGVAVIKIKSGAVIKQESAKGKDLGRGTGSLWLVVCEEHKKLYPECESFPIESF